MKKLVLFLLAMLSFLLLKSQVLPKERPDFNSIKTIFQTLQQYQKVIIKTDLDSLQLNKLAATQVTLSFYLFNY